VRWDAGEAAIGPGYCILVGVADTDQENDADYLAEKILKLRVFSDEAGKFNLSAAQVQAAFLVVSQFTLFADARGQNRPSFLHAARPELGRPLLERFIARLRASGLPVETGSFGAQMAVELVNDGPVTLVLSTDPWEPRIG
jgi:D-aminoacyl-tRNA deacylase